MMTGGGGIPTLVTHVYAVCTRRFFLPINPPLSSAMGMRLGGAVQAKHTFLYKNFMFAKCLCLISINYFLNEYAC